MAGAARRWPFEPFIGCASRPTTISVASFPAVAWPLLARLHRCVPSEGPGRGQGEASPPRTCLLWTCVRYGLHRGSRIEVLCRGPTISRFFGYRFLVSRALHDAGHFTPTQKRAASIRYSRANSRRWLRVGHFEAAVRVFYSPADARSGAGTMSHPSGTSGGLAMLWVRFRPRVGIRLHGRGDSPSAFHKRLTSSVRGFS